MLKGSLNGGINKEINTGDLPFWSILQVPLATELININNKRGT